MPVTVNSSAVYDALINLIDTVNNEPDPVARLSLLRYLDDQYRTRILKERDRAAYEARTTTAAADIADAIGADIKEVYYWASRYQQEHRKPRITRKQRYDLDSATDLRAITHR